jgi:hypothetical protein
MATRLLGAKLNLLSVRDVLNARDGDKSDGGGLLLRCPTKRGLGNPIADRLRRGLELLGKLLRAAASAHQFDQLLPEFRRVCRATAGHREPPSIPTLKSVHETGSTPSNA